MKMLLFVPSASLSLSRSSLYSAVISLNKLSEGVCPGYTSYQSWSRSISRRDSLSLSHTHTDAIIVQVT
jgi:hypothetical protein